MRSRFALLLVSALLLSSHVASAALPRGVERAVKVDRFTTSGRQGVRWAAKGIRSAKKDVLGEVFAISDEGVVSALHDRLENNVPVRGNVNPETMGKKPIPALVHAGADFRSWGGDAIRDGKYQHALNPRMVHAKVFHFDKKSWFSTASLLRGSEDSLDATAIVSGKPAKLARAISDRAHAGDMPGMHKAAAEGRAHGVLLNDASAGIHHLTEGIHDVIDTAKHELVVSFKIVESVDLVNRLSAAAARGVKVTLLTHPSKMTPEAAAALSPDIHLAADTEGVLHANMLVADRKVGIFGSAHAKRRALGEPSWRQSREMGFVIDDEDVLAQMRDAILEHASGTRAKLP